jgi:hypothetical protein
LIKGKNIVQQMELEKLVIHMEKNENGFPTSYHTEKLNPDGLRT